MKIIITFETETEAFDGYDFDNEIKKVLKQAEEYLTDMSNSEILKDSNENTIGHVFRSTPIRRSKRTI